MIKPGRSMQWGGERIQQRILAAGPDSRPESCRVLHPAPRVLAMLPQTHIYDMIGPAFVIAAVIYFVIYLPASPVYWLFVGMFGPAVVLAFCNIVIMIVNKLMGRKVSSLRDERGVLEPAERQSAFDSLREAERSRIDAGRPPASRIDSVQSTYSAHSPRVSRMAGRED